MKLSVQKYDGELYDEMIRFNESVYKERAHTKNQVIHKLESVDDNNNSRTLIALDGDKIVGQMFLLKAGFFYKGKLEECYFGCDYIVDESHRNTGIGIKLLNKTIKEQQHIGIGFSEISKKIHLRLKENLIGSIDKYLYVNSLLTYFYIVCKSILKIPLKGEAKSKPGPEKLLVNGYNVIKKDKIDALNTPWNSELLEISRTADYNKWRFGGMLKGKYETYNIYDTNENLQGYFIIRTEHWRGINILLVVDYRFQVNNTEVLNCICAAAKIIMKKKSLDAVLFGSSLKIIDGVLVKNKFKKVGVPSEIITNIKMDEKDLPTSIDNRTLIFATPADSDFEYNLGSNIWEINN